MSKPMKAEATAVVSIAPLEPKRMSEQSLAWNQFDCTIPSDAVQHVLDNRLWRLCARRLQRGDVIKWRSDCLTQFGEAAVVACDVATGNIELWELWAKTVASATIEETELGGYSVRDLGVQRKFAIIRDDDNHIVQDGIPSRTEAMRRIKAELVPNLVSQAAGGHVAR
jgi:hypothetical protein